MLKLSEEDFAKIERLRKAGVARVTFCGGEAGDVYELQLHPAELTTGAADSPLDGDEPDGTNGDVVRALTLLAGRGNARHGDEG